MGKYSGILGKYSGILGKYIGILGKYIEVVVFGTKIVFFGENTFVFWENTVFSGQWSGVSCQWSVSCQRSAVTLLCFSQYINMHWLVPNVVTGFEGIPKKFGKSQFLKELLIKY